VPARVCIAIRESTTEEAVAAIYRASVWADLVEVRADYIQDLDIVHVLKDKPCPIIFTLRPHDEGGNFSGSERCRLEMILEAAAAGADYVDVEFSSFWQGVLESVPRERVILSYHNFEETPATLEHLLESMAATGAGILKIATRANRLSDNLRIARALEIAAAKRWNLCALAMGNEGIASRILGPLWGSWMTFASLPGHEGTAEGQLPADELADRYRVREIGRETLLYGVLGKPLRHTLSPLLHNAAFVSRGLDALYLPLEAEGIEDFLEFSSVCEVQGVSVTLPYKEAACRLAHSLSVEANDTGAVNTLVRHDSGWHGENTDVDGFMRPLRRRLHVGSLRAVVLGAGGAARSVVQGLSSQGASVCVVARDPGRARQLADKFKAEHARWDQLPHLRWDMLINATPVGMHPETEKSPVPADWLSGEWVYDLVYNPRETRLLKDAVVRGCKTISGLEMFLGQAVKQQQLWCGGQAPEPAMREALEGWLLRTSARMAAR
jgi:3-dehydroquinate dehydratase/shikimate dehydrogenase